MKYSNPRTEAIIENWPLGGNKRGRVTFSVETKPGKGERAVRVSIDPRTGRESKPKVLTFARKVRIVDGDDGKTYIAELTAYGFVSIMQSNMQFQHGDAIFPDNPNYAEVAALFDSCASSMDRTAIIDIR